MTYRASLGTRGELRRIAAEAEIAAIERVRPWIRKVQPCKLAPHVIVPQWTRLEHPVEPKPPPRIPTDAEVVAGELLDEILETACAKKFRRTRPRRGRTRRRTENDTDVDMADASPMGTPAASATPAASPSPPPETVMPAVTPPVEAPADTSLENQILAAQGSLPAIVTDTKPELQEMSTASGIIESSVEASGLPSIIGRGNMHVSQHVDAVDGTPNEGVAKTDEQYQGSELNITQLNAPTS